MTNDNDQWNNAIPSSGGGNPNVFSPGTEGPDLPSPETYPFGASLEEMDCGVFFNMRDWLRDAVEAKGAVMVGGGIGLGQADIDVECDGCRYNISIRPLPRLKK